MLPYASFVFHLQVDMHTMEYYGFYFFMPSFMFDLCCRGSVDGCPDSNETDVEVFVLLEECEYLMYLSYLKLQQFVYHLFCSCIR